MCEVFFFGTALKTPSQMSDRIAGTLSDIAGIDMVAAGYIELKAFRSTKVEEVWKAVKLGEASRDQIESAENVCEVAMVDEKTSTED